MLYFFKVIVWWFVLLFSIMNKLFPNPVSFISCILILVITFIITLILAK